MCLAIVKLPDANIPVESLRSGWIGNPDGAGFAYANKGKIKVVKGLMTLKEFYVAYDAAIKKHPKAPFLVHFRIRSMGDKSADNTHPYEFNNTALIHNGTIDGTGAVYNTGESDTRKFVERYKEGLTIANVRKYKEDFDKALSFNKVALLDGTGQHVIINENSGNWQNGVWYSNYSYRSSSSRFRSDDDEGDSWLGQQSLYDNATMMM